jgi:hypothetical protein
MENSAGTKIGPQKASEWLAGFGVEKGQWYLEVKAAVRKAMRSPKFSNAARVWLCLRLHTIPFRSELAVTLVRLADGRVVRRRLTPKDVCDETGLLRQHVQSGMVDLEAEGMAKRLPIEGNDLRKGNIALYCFVKPIDRGTSKPFVTATGYKFADDIDADQQVRLSKLLKFFRVSQNGFVICSAHIDALQVTNSRYKEAQKAAYSNAKNEILRALQGGPYKEERSNYVKSQSVSQKELREEEPTDRLTDDVEALSALPQVRRLIAQLGETVSPQIAREVYAHLGSATLAELDARIARRATTVTSLGLLPALAADVAQASAKLQALTRKDRTAADRQRQQQYDEMLRQVREGWDQLSADDQRWYREMFPELAARGGGVIP